MFALSLPALAGVGGLAIDFATLNLKRAALQSAADEAAISAAKQLSLASANDTAIQASVTTYLSNQLRGDDAAASGATLITHAGGASSGTGGMAMAMAAPGAPATQSASDSVTVQVTEAWTPFFAHFVSPNVTPIVVAATATLQGNNKLCVLSLNGSDSNAYKMMNNAHVQAPTCGIFSNSVAANGMVLQNTASLTASVICSSGGIVATASQTNVTPETDCPVMPDPLAGHATPTVGACTANSYAVSSGTITLAPGVYCGGMSITGTARVTFSPGTYVIKNGAFTIAGQAVASGMNTGFYLVGDNALINFAGNSTINLSGAESGVMAGLLFFADKGESDGSTHVINSPNVQVLTGTIYLPMGDILVNPNGNVAGTSAYTAIIAQRVRMGNGSNLVMNTNYASTNVPVPDGLRTTATVVLSN